MIDNLTNNRELFNRDNRRDQLTLTLKITTAQVVNNNSPIQDYVHQDDHTQPTFELTPSGFKPFTALQQWS